jgi:predicted kinase
MADYMRTRGSRFVAAYGMAIAHLISGLPCSGKTTYATELRADVNGVLFSLDRWLITLFGRYSIAIVGYDEHVRRVLACRELIWSVASEFLQRDVDVILDDGFFLRAHRMERVRLANGVGAKARIHFLDTPLHVVRARLDARNASLPAFNFQIAPETLEGFLGLFERPAADEGAELVVVAGSLSTAG